MVLYIRAAIEAHHNGVIKLQQSLIAHMVLPGGDTLYQRLGDTVKGIEANPQLLLN